MNDALLWRETRKDVFVCDDLPNASIYKLKWGGWRYNLGGQDSCTFGQRDNAERALIEQMTTKTAFGAPL